MTPRDRVFWCCPGEQQEERLEERYTIKKTNKNKTSINKQQEREREREREREKGEREREGNKTHGTRHRTQDTGHRTQGTEHTDRPARETAELVERCLSHTHAQDGSTMKSRSVSLQRKGDIGDIMP